MTDLGWGDSAKAPVMRCGVGDTLNRGDQDDQNAERDVRDPFGDPLHDQERQHGHLLPLHRATLDRQAAAPAWRGKRAHVAAHVAVAWSTAARRLYSQCSVVRADLPGLPVVLEQERTVSRLVKLA